MGVLKISQFGLVVWPAISIYIDIYIYRYFSKELYFILAEMPGVARGILKKKNF